MNKLWLSIGLAVLIAGVAYMYLAYFAYSKEYFTYMVENDRQWSPTAFVGTLLPSVITVVGMAIIYYCFRPIKLTRASLTLDSGCTLQRIKNERRL